MFCGRCGPLGLVIIENDSDSDRASDTDSECLTPRSPAPPLVRSFDTFGNSTVNAEVASSGPRNGDFQALACPPMEVTVKVPANYKPGQAMRPRGPHGQFTIKPPEAKPGETFTFLLAPPSDMEVTIPKDYCPGNSLVFERSDGERVKVEVPSGLGPGDTFEVIPPALMVKVPDGAKAGDSVVFRDEKKNSDWLRAQVPKDVHSVGYFAARVPSKCAFEPAAARLARSPRPGVRSI